MQTGKTIRFQFIDHSDDPRLGNRSRTGSNTVIDSRRKAHAHAARTAHARKRIARTQEHLARKTNTTNSKIEYEINEHRASLLSPISALSQSRNDPFDSCAAKLSSMEHFLIDHYAQFIIPKLHSHCDTLHRVGETLDRMLTEWLRYTLTQTDCMHGVLLMASRSMIDHNHQSQYFNEVAASHKIACVRSVIDAISRSPINLDSTFALIFILAIDEICIGNEQMFERHADGAIKMVMLNGGPETLGLNGFLHSLFKVVVNMNEEIKANVPWQCGEREKDPLLGLDGGI